MKRTSCRPWNRKLWGVEFSNSRAEKLLLGALWDDAERQRIHHIGEPARALLFCTRSQARAWCARQRAKYADYPQGHLCRAWRFRPVRVTEVVEIA